MCGGIGNTGKLKEEILKCAFLKDRFEKGGVIGPIYDCVFFLGLMLGFGWVFSLGSVREILRGRVSLGGF